MIKEVMALKESLEKYEYVVYSATFNRDWRSSEVSVDLHLENTSFIKLLKANKYTTKRLEYEVWDSVSSEPACLSLRLFDNVTLKALWGKDELLEALHRKYLDNVNWEYQVLQWYRHNIDSECDSLRELCTSALLETCVLLDAWGLEEQTGGESN